MNPSTQDSRTEVDSEAQALQQRLAALQEENATLEAEAVARENRQRLEEEIRIEENRRERLRSEAQELSVGGSSQDAVETPVGRQGVAVPMLPHSHPIFQSYKHQHAEKPNAYKGKSLREYSDFVAACKNEYMTFPDWFSVDKHRIQYAVKHLDRRPRIAWERQNIEDHTWDTFQEFLLDQICDKVNRQIRAVNDLELAKMRENQPISEFADYLNLLQSQIKGQTEQQRYNTLLAKIPREIQLTLLARADDSLPTTQTALIGAIERIQGKGITFEGANRGRNADAGAESSTTGRKRAGSPQEKNHPRKRPSWAQRDRAGQNRNPNTTPVQGGPRAGGSTAPCRGCGRLGHSIGQCDQVRCFTCNKQGHISPNCPENLQGKGKAQA